MTQPNLDHVKLLETGILAARRGSEILMRYFQDGVTMRNKSSQGGHSYDLVSDADVESESVIADCLREHFPQHELLGEESLALGRVDADDLWIIDPLDGTNNFAHRLPQFAVSIAYYHRGQAEVAVVTNPARNDWFTAVRGGGAKYNDRLVQVSDERELNQSLVGVGFYYDRGEMMRRTLRAIEDLFGQHIHGIRRFGTASLDLCMVGCGQLSGFFEYQLSPWDFAAGRLFLEEAGGRITDARGNPLEIRKTSVAASNNLIHDCLVEITRRHHLP